MIKLAFLFFLSECNIRCSFLEFVVTLTAGDFHNQMKNVLIVLSPYS